MKFKLLIFTISITLAVSIIAFITSCYLEPIDPLPTDDPTPPPVITEPPLTPSPDTGSYWGEMVWGQDTWGE